MASVVHLVHQKLHTGPVISAGAALDAGTGEVLDADPRLEGGVTDRWDERPLTRFERRGLAAGRQVTDLCYRRVS